jgi:hypothetical protein
MNDELLSVWFGESRLLILPLRLETLMAGVFGLTGVKGNVTGEDEWEEGEVGVRMDKGVEEGGIGGRGMEGGEERCSVCVPFTLDSFVSVAVFAIIPVVSVPDVVVCCLVVVAVS